MAKSLFTRFLAFTALLPCSCFCLYNIDTTETHSGLTGALWGCWQRSRWVRAPLNWLLSLPVPADFTPGSWNCRNRDVVSCSFFLPIFEKLAWNGFKLQAVLSLCMRNGQFLVYAFSCVHCTSAMFYFMFLWYPQHRHPFGANWCYLRVLATFTLVESPLKSTCIIACTPGFHSMDFTLQKRGVPTMLILVAKPQQPSLNRFQDIRTFFVAHA